MCSYISLLHKYGDRLFHMTISNARNMSYGWCVFSTRGKPPLSTAALQLWGNTRDTSKKDLHYIHVLKPITPNGEFTELNRQKWRIINSRAHPIGFSSPNLQILLFLLQEGKAGIALASTTHWSRCWTAGSVMDSPTHTFQLSFPLAFLFALEHLEGNFSLPGLLYQMMTHRAL